MIARRVASFGVAVFLLSSAAQAGTFTVFGPRDYMRGAEQPQTIRETFTIQHTLVPYKLRLVNGGAAGTFGKVTSAIVKINGMEIFGTRDFNANTPATIEKSVTLTATNEIAVEVRGAPGDGITITVLGEDAAPPVITAAVDPLPNAAGWHRDNVTVTFTCSDSMTPVVSCTEPIIVTTEAAGQVVNGSAVDAAGNSASVAVTLNIDKTPPEPAIAAPAPLSIVRTPSIPLAGTTAAGIAPLVAVACNTQLGSVTGSSFSCQATLNEGMNNVFVTAIDAADNESSISHPIVLDTIAPAIVVERPVDGSTTNAPAIDVAGAVTDADQVASLKVNGTEVAVSGDTFSASIELAEGANPISIVTTDRAGNSATSTLSVTRNVLPALAITSPADLAIVSTATATVQGTVTDAESVTVNGIAAAVIGNTFTAGGVPLAQGRTVITASARSAGGHLATQSILVYRDAIPPRIIVDYPADNSVVHQGSITVTGMVDDLVVGTINPIQARVTVNGAAAEVANRSFIARGVTLTPGLNTLLVSAQDQGGNSSTATVRVTYSALAGVPTIAVVSGNGQTATISSELPQPLTVRLTNSAGAPVAGQEVAFRVVENNGTLKTGGSVDRTVIASTNAAGLAAAVWTLGSHSGAGNQVVEATAAGFTGTVRFEAVGRPASAAAIVVDSGGNQYGVVGSPVPRPLIAVVIDAGSNRLAGVPVTFAAVQGGGRFANGQPSITVSTDSDGRAIVTPTLGPEAGQNAFAATVTDVLGQAGFLAVARIAGPAENTRISGVVLDNTDMPVAGVTIRLDGSPATVQSNAQGQFTIAAPVGYVKLLADGSTAQRPGTWPTLEFAMYTLPGQDNTLGMPIYLLPIDVQRGLFVDEVTGGTLTVPELPGFSLTVKPGSVTFPGGGRTGTISVTLVHADKMPMPPGFGQQPRFIVTIQPVGAHFDPPAAVTFPNVDGLSPGEVTELYSFDHDLGQFVAIGTGSVSEDAGMLLSDPGVGIVKAGWHCGGNPPPGGTPNCCPPCEKCTGTTCIPDINKNSPPCCKGVQYNPATRCCVAGVIRPKKPISDLAQCPNKVDDPAASPLVNGCSFSPDNPNAGPSPTGGMSLCALFGDAPSFKPACDGHDTCYDTCNAKKEDCDKAFHQALLNICAPIGGGLCFERCKLNADKYFGMVSAFGGSAYDGGQKKNCKCCP